MRLIAPAFAIRPPSQVADQFEAFGRWASKPVVGEGLDAITLEVPMAGRPCEHVQEFEVAGCAIAISDLIV